MPKLWVPLKHVQLSLVKKVDGQERKIRNGLEEQKNIFLKNKLGIFFKLPILYPGGI
jgi:hypothetical protein